MKIIDSIYGNFNIEPIFKLLIDTKEVQRLKHIHQGGASYLINPKWNITRYDHSIGVMLFIRFLGGRLPQICTKNIRILGLLNLIYSHIDT